MFVKVSKAQREKMMREGGYREKRVMKNAVCVVDASGSYGKGAVKFHTADGHTALYKPGRGWVG